MQRKLFGRVLLLGFATALAGCQIIGTPGTGRANNANNKRLAAAQGPSETEQGRQHLAAQRNGLAIEAFNRALVFGEAAAPALNGLGVAYAKLGRADLAYRFFTQAVSADARNSDYTRNLAVLTRSNGFTLAAIRPASVKAAPFAKLPGQSAGGSRLYRESNGQFTLETLPSIGPHASCAVPPRGTKTIACAPARLPVVAANNRTGGSGEVIIANKTDQSRTMTRQVIIFSLADQVAVIAGPRPAAGSPQQ